MYQYFLGKKSNLATRTEDKPIVIAVDRTVNFKINEWLDLFRLDLDVLINGIRTVVDTEICSIENTTKSVMELSLENGKTAELGFVYIDDEHPRFLVEYENTKFLCSPNNAMVIEKKEEEVSGIKFEVTYTPISQSILIMKKEDISISIEFNSAEFDVFENMKNAFIKISDISEMYKLLEWTYQFIPEDANHIFLNICRERKKAAEFAELKNNEVEKYKIMMGPLIINLGKDMKGTITVTGGVANEDEAAKVAEKGKKIVGMMAAKMKRLNELLKK